MSEAIPFAMLMASRPPNGPEDNPGQTDRNHLTIILPPVVRWLNFKAFKFRFSAASRKNAQAGLLRTESRGAHQRADFPGMLPEWGVSGQDELQRFSRYSPDDSRTGVNGRRLLNWLEAQVRGTAGLPAF